MPAPDDGPADDTGATRTRPDKPPRRRGARTSTAQPVAPLEPGTTLGRYVVLERLGKGGMAVVYKAYDPELHRNVAVKLLRIDAARGKSVEARSRLLREAQALAQLSHPNVIAIHDVGTRGDDVFIAMELVSGATLRSWLRERHRPLREILDVMRAAGRGLAAAHAVGLVHRDFKPDNVMVGDDGRVRVLDFGLARRHDHDTLTPSSGPVEATPRAAAEPTAEAGDERDDDGADDDGADDDDVGETRTGIDPDETSALAAALDAVPAPPPTPTPSGLLGPDLSDLLHSPLTRVGIIIGTPTYMAPEQHRGRETDARSDQFSFCVVLYEAIYGERPFAGTTRAALAAAVALGQVREPPADRRAPGWLRKAVLRGLAVDPAERHPSMDAILAELGRDPAAARKQLVVAAAVIAGIAVAAALWFGRAPAAAPPCQLTGAELDGAWDAGRRAQVAAALGRGAPAMRVGTLVDGYAGRWRAMRVEACRATRVAGTQSEHLLDLRMRCLDRRRDQLGALTAVLAGRDRAAAAHAIDAVYALPELAGCADVAALTAAVPPPDDARLRARVDALDHRLDHAAALQQAGLIPAALTEAQAAAAAARDVAYPPVRARALFRLGDVQSDGGDGPAAEATLYDAAKAAAAARDDRLVAEAYLDLAWVIGYQEARQSDAGVLTRVADAAIAHVGDDPILRSRYLHRVAVLDYMQSRYAIARAHWEEALPLAERAFGLDHPRVADLLVSLGNVALAQGQLDAVGPYYERALSIYQRALGAEHPRVTFALENLGALREKQGRYEDARGYYARSLELTERALGKDHPDVGHALFNLSNALRRLGRTDEARAAAARSVAIEERDRPDHPDVALALNALGEAELDAGDTTAARAHFTRALAILEKAEGGEHVDIAQALSALGRLERREGHARESCALAGRAVAIADKVIADDAQTRAHYRAELAACAGAPRP